MDTNNSLFVLAAIVGQILTFLSVLNAQRNQNKKEERNHAWANEERDRIAAELTKTASALATTTAGSAAQLAAVASQAAAELARMSAEATAKVEALLLTHNEARNVASTRILTAIAGSRTEIAANTVLTKEAVARADDAFKEANNVNTKISWSVKKTRSMDHQLEEDPEQGKLELEKP